MKLQPITDPAYKLMEKLLTAAYGVAQRATTLADLANLPVHLIIGLLGSSVLKPANERTELLAFKTTAATVALFDKIISSALDGAESRSFEGTKNRYLTALHSHGHEALTTYAKVITDAEAAEAAEAAAKVAKAESAIPMPPPPEASNVH